MLSHLLQFRRRARKSKAGRELESLGIAIFFDEIAQLPISTKRAPKFVSLANQLAAAGSASIVSMEELAGKLRFAQSSAMELSGH